MGARGTAVVIEDDEDVRGLLKHVCARAKIRAHLAGNGLAGIEAVRLHTPDVIILDFGLRDLDGIEVARRILRFSNAHILMITAQPDDVAAHYKDAGINHLSPKPFSVKELRRHLESALASDI
jgi:DNA-binding response OmpR family regulator